MCQRGEQFVFGLRRRYPHADSYTDSNTDRNPNKYADLGGLVVPAEL